MSSDEDNDFGSAKNRRLRESKKRRVARACDVCRRRKVRCDGEQIPGRKCANCAAANLECSYIQAMKKYPEGYVEALETKLDKMETLLKRLHPTEDFTHEIGVAITRENWMKSGVLGDADAIARVRSNGFESADPSSEDEDTSVKLHELTKHLHNLHVGAFRGKSSSATLVEAAYALKQQASDTPINGSFVQAKRDNFWGINAFEKELLDRECSVHSFPEPDLMWALFDCYFKHLNMILPVLHRPTFEKHVREGLHLRDESFAGVVLCVCAVGARTSNDPRVLVEKDGGRWISAGWDWFSQVQTAQKALVSTSRLYDLQTYCLATVYILGNSLTQRGWNLCGIGIRLALDIGAHKKKVYGEVRTAEDEQIRRAFWVLVWLDRWMSALQGRPCGLDDDDLDLDYPAVCDDEYWEHPDPTKAFQQPPDKPSYMAYFVESVKQCQILGSALSTIYASHKKRTKTRANGPEWEQRVTASFDSQMNAWADALPHHLRWNNATQQDDLFLMQSTHLHVQFYHLQILVHRPFMSARKEPHLSFRSLAVCINAARSCSRVVDTMRRRIPTYYAPYIMVATLTSGAMLLLGVLNVKRTGISMNQEREIEAVHKCLNVLKDMETRWQAAGRLWDVLSSLLNATEEPTPAVKPQANVKRGRDSADPTGAVSDHSSPSGSTTTGYAGHSSSSGTGYMSSPQSEHSLRSSPPISVPQADVNGTVPGPGYTALASGTVYAQAPYAHDPQQRVAVTQDRVRTYVRGDEQRWATDGTGYASQVRSETAAAAVHASYQAPPAAPYYPEPPSGSTTYVNQYNVATEATLSSGYAAYLPTTNAVYDGYAEPYANEADPYMLPREYAYTGTQAILSASASVADWRRLSASENGGSLADAVPPEHRWQPVQMQPYESQINAMWRPTATVYPTGHHQ